MLRSKGNGFVKVLILICVIYFTVTLVNTQLEISAKKQELLQAQALCEQQRIANKETQRALLQGEEEEHIARAARDKLGLAHPDERVFIDISGMK